MQFPIHFIPCDRAIEGHSVLPAAEEAALHQLQKTSSAVRSPACVHHHIQIPL